MACESEAVAIGSLKHDPAWKHCQMFRNNDRTQLKCVYCYKVFSGGGIHRIKEHLACYKGNASCCPRVPPEVQRTMQISLEGVVVKKKKKLNVTNEVRNVASDSTFGGGQCELGVGLVERNDTIQGTDLGAFSGKRNRRRVDEYYSPVYEVSNDVKLWSAKEKNQVDVAIGRFMFDVGLPLDAVNSSYFQSMIDAMTLKGPGLEATSYHDLRNWVLKNAVDEVNVVLDKHKATWGRSGCSVLADEWVTETGRVLLNFFVSCAEGTVFLKSVDASSIIGSSEELFELLTGVVEEVGVRNVVQVITDSTENYSEAGKRLTETLHTLYWTPCASRAISLMLEDIGKIEWISVILEHAKVITRFVYNHGAALNMMRRYTGGRELVHPIMTRSVTDFMTLKSIFGLKDSLQSMVTSQEWTECPLSKLPEGIETIDIIYNESFWSSCSTIVHLTDQLVRILRTIHKRPATGYILAGMHHAKESIKNEMVEEEAYMSYWKIIDSRWIQQLQHPLHEAGFFLNPRFLYSLEGEERDKIPSGMLDCVERLVPDINIQDKINKELILYKNAEGDFGRKMAIRATHTLLPAEWWSTYGGGCPHLARLAIHILSQTCSANVVKPSSIAFERVHKTRNHLEHQRLFDLVFVQYNLRLQQMVQNNELGPMDPISGDCSDLAEDWVTEKKEIFGYGDSDWVAVQQPAAQNMVLESPIEVYDDLIAGFKYQQRPILIKDVEPEEIGRQ